MLALAGRGQMHGLDADNALDRVALLGVELDASSDDHTRVDTADKAKLDHTVLDERLDDHTDLVHVCAQHDRLLSQIASLAEHHEVAHRVGLNAVGIRHRRLQNILAHFIFPARRAEFCTQGARQCQKFFIFPFHYRRTSPSNWRKKWYIKSPTDSASDSLMVSIGVCI